MVFLRDLVDDPKRLVGRVKVTPAGPLKLKSATAALGARLAATKLQEGVPELQARIAKAARNQTLETLSRGDLRAVCGVYLHSPEPPGRNAEIGDPIIAEVNRRSLRSAMLALFNAYLDHFKFDDADILRLGSQLQDLIKGTNWRNADGWAARAVRLALFEPSEAPALLAAKILVSPERPEAVLSEAGLATEVRARGRLVEAAFQLGCLVSGKSPPEKGVALQLKLIEWANGTDGRMMFPGSFPQFASGLLEPWSKSDPEKLHQALLVQTLEQAGGGDPRTNPARWREVEQHAPAAYGTLLRWLTRASVMQFLEIVGRSMTDADSRRMWAYRRSFWTSYLLGTDGGPTIQKAWIAFGRNAAGLAREAARVSGDQSFVSFGKHNDKSDMHSALIMEIGDLLIVDWSHNAKCNVWKRGDRGRPALFKSSYSNGELYSAPLQESHVAPANYTWQKKLAKIIEGRNFFSEKPSWRPKNV